MSKQRTFAIGIIAIFLMLAGCKMGPNFTRPALNVPDSYRADSTAGISVANLAWWELFQDSVLQELIEVALVNNRNLRGSLDRIDAAYAQTGIVRASLYPSLNYGLDGTTQYTVSGDGGKLTANATPVLSVSYQVDLWGRIRRSNEAALQEYLATEEGYRNLTISIVAGVASGYLLLRDLDNRLLISELTARSWSDNLEIVRTRYRAGMISEVNLFQAEIQLKEAETAIQTFSRLRDQTENAISLLLGVAPQSIPRGQALQEQVVPPEVPAGLPSELLDRRPDLRQAERSLHAQTARIGVAEALKYPQLTLSADLGASLANPAAGFAALGAQLFGPLVNAGAAKRQVEVEVARTRQLLNAYEQTFLVALREVSDALIAVGRYKREFEIRKEQMLAAEEALKLSWVRYEGGMANYLEVLDLQRSKFSSQLKASETLQLELTSMVQLYLALGGGWKLND